MYSLLPWWLGGVKIYNLVTLRLPGAHCPAKLFRWDLVMKLREVGVNHAPGSPNIAVAGKWGPRIESMYFLLKMGMSFQPAMLVKPRG